MEWRGADSLCGVGEGAEELSPATTIRRLPSGTGGVAAGLPAAVCIASASRGVSTQRDGFHLSVGADAAEALLAVSGGGDMFDSYLSSAPAGGASQ